MKLYLGIFLVAYLYSVEGLYIYIGRGSYNFYFAMRSSPSEWDWGMNFCQSFQFMPGSIKTGQDHQLITNFLNTSTDIDNANRALWVAATDHRSEGTFQWLWNMANVTVGSWAPGMPSINRTANCLAINKEGYFMEDSCFESGRDYYTLCEAPFFNHNSASMSDEKVNNFDTNNAKTYDPLTYRTPLDFTLIGQVGNKMYFAYNEEVSWSQSLDLCHFAEMRLATPEQSEQLDFIEEYVSRQQTVYHIGGTDRLSLSCLRSNTEFRWFYSGNPIANQTNLIGGYYMYLCTFIIPTVGLRTTGCAHGQGAYARPICEITLQI